MNEETNQLASLAEMFKALGDPTRLRIFTFLCGCCGTVSVEENGDVRTADGPTVGEVCCRVTGVERITSTLSHHLKELRQANLITMERRGKNIVCAVEPDALKTLAAFLKASAKGEENGCC